MIRFPCTSCHMRLSVPPTQAGRRVKCPFCAAPTAVPVQCGAPTCSHPGVAGRTRMFVAGMSAALGDFVRYCGVR
jgi:hypothetical protein